MRHRLARRRRVERHVEGSSRDLIWTANSLDQEGQIYEAKTDAVTQTSGDSYSMDFHGARMLACRPVPGHSVPRDEL